MDVNVRTPDVNELNQILRVLEQWQCDGGPLDLHPGDLGWYSLRGPAATAAAIRVWSCGDTALAIALLDGPQLLRFAMDPSLRQDESLAVRIVADVGEPATGVLDAGSATIEARGAYALSEQLTKEGWLPGDPWTPLKLNLAAPIDTGGPHVEIIEPDRTDEWVSVHWSAFRGTPIPHGRLRNFVDGWRAAAEGPFLGSARILSLYADSRAVAVAAVWSAGNGRPGLIEPMGVHREHRGRGYGTIMTRAAAASLREMDSSSATVCAESSNAGALSTYLAAGFSAQPEVADWRRGP
ncbi:GCN5-related N-acetyltransferase [Pseudarthrobacter chlorophenolicus A6]|uniref:GCN5-related N-acetyltransferase n=1 Tax=Pseudarthrobacter chlorophenolicus (strain ATCC 700700 / DSM 12829 / CIP 107037 / JCM 12360 / KCTC 9906 / NCIMB 13794 / A6) TaxID=452863 RepID=B8HGI5_PSECP|nr:GNAT family N-acetyltransferase [Pseudarthrobacter chlorophenolicus]ACL41251.1 GCN5-related N-acetyltransferase [Pseudarthrobacter chlorophenolicus A6]SDQ67593.1 Acetyltransferase (GNAT) family protein [Pseudarthrobacter chlorophenolicus]